MSQSLAFRRFTFAIVLLLCAGCARKTESSEGSAPPKEAPPEPAQATAAPEPEPSKADIVQEFGAFVSERNSCAQASECVMLSPGCPLGCGVGVRAEHAADAEAKAKALIAEAEKQNGACTYKCAALHLECTEGHCTAVPE